MVLRTFAWLTMFLAMTSGHFVVAGVLLVILLGTST